MTSTDTLCLTTWPTRSVSQRLQIASTTINASGAVELLICVIVGALAMLAALVGSRSLLRKVTAGPARAAAD